MKKLDSKISSMISKLCAFLLALMGFSCSSLEVDDEEEMLLMYGCPTGSYEVKGMVTNEEGKPVSDAIIRVTDEHNRSDSYVFESDTTDAQGFYTATGTHVSYKKIKIVCLPQDGIHKADSTLVELEYKKAENKEDHFWYVGHAETTVNFTLKKKQDKE